MSQSLDDMVVIVGAGELGPVGSSRTRFDVELTGALSAAGVTELAYQPAGPDIERELRVMAEALA